MPEGDPTASGGGQESWRWRARAHHTKPTVNIIERGDKANDVAGVPFGFGRELAPEHDEDAWEGMGL